MIGLDTHVLVRLLTRDDEKQAEKVRLLLEEHAAQDGAFFVSDIVLAELAWTLNRSYGLGKDAIARAMSALVDNSTLSFEARAVLRHAQDLFEKSTAGYADCLIVARAQATRCASLLTFDKAMRGISGVALL